MRIVVLKQAKNDLKWWRRYYKITFPAGKTNSSRRFQRTVQLVAENPYAGQKVEGTTLHMIPIANTPFILVYRPGRSEIQIARVWDARQEPSSGFQED
jgi:plasmid stabilization system protein ParE